MMVHLAQQTNKMKYTTEYCRNNKVAIKYSSREEFIKICNYFDSNLIKFFESNQECVRFCSYAGNSIGFSSTRFYKEVYFKIITFQQFMQSQIKKLKDFTDKDVIHCPTDELRAKIKVLLRKLNFPYSNCLNLFWENYKENFCFLPTKDEYSRIEFYKEQGYTIYKAEDILALHEEKQNLDEYIVKCETAEETTIAANFIKGTTEEDWTHWNYAVKSNIYSTNYVLHDDIPDDYKHLPILTFKEFQQKIMKETKIIGYKCPISLFNGEVEKGTLFVKLSDTMYEAQSSIKEIRTMKFLPKEIVETWEAIYDQDYKVGDWIIWDSCEKPYKIWKINNNTVWIIYEGRKENHQQYEIPSLKKTNLKKLTQTEIDSLFNKTLTLSNGKEVIVNKGIIKANNETVSLESWKNLLITGKKINSYDVELTDATFKIGCWTGVKLADIQLIIKTAEEQLSLL